MAPVLLPSLKSPGLKRRQRRFRTGSHSSAHATERGARYPTPSPSPVRERVADLAWNLSLRASPAGQNRHSKGLIAKFVQRKDLAPHDGERSGKQKTRHGSRVYFKASSFDGVKWHVSAGCLWGRVHSGISALLEELQLKERLGGGDDGLLVGARCPAEDAPCFFAGGILRLAELGCDEPDRGIAQRGEAYQPVGELAGGHTSRRSAHAEFENRGDIANPEEIARGAEEALALSGGMGHGAEMHIGHVAHVDESEVEARAAGHGAVHQPLDEKDGGGIVGSEDGAEHAHRVDDGKLESAAFASNEIPCGTFGQGLRFWISGHVAVEVAPILLREWRRLRGMAIADGSERRGEHHAPDAGVACGAEHTQSPFAGGDDQLILIFGSARRQRRCDVQHVVAASDSVRPSGVVFQISDNEGEAVARFLCTTYQQHGADIGFALERADRGAHPVARFKKLQAAVCADEARAAGYEDEFVRHSLCFLDGCSWGRSQFCGGVNRF